MKLNGKEDKNGLLKDKKSSELIASNKSDIKEVIEDNEGLLWINNGSLRRRYFIANHASKLNNKLNSKLGKEVKIIIEPTSNEDSEEINLAIRASGVKKELLNFSQDVAERINRTDYYEYNNESKEKIEEVIKQFIKDNNLYVDIDWEEQSRFIHLFYNNSLYENMDIYDKTQRYYYIVLESLYESICDFLNNTAIQTIENFRNDYNK